MEVAWEELGAGIAAGLAQDSLLHPLDTLRARLDTGATSSSARASGSPVQAMLLEARAVAAADGLRGLYRGYTMCLSMSAPANALYFGSYRASRRALQPTADMGVPAPARDAAAGISAEVVASLLWTPLDVVKQRIQVAPHGLGAFGAARAACLEVGVKGLWRGYFAGLAVWGPFSSIYFASYEFLREMIGRSGGPQNPSAKESIPAGLGAGALAALSTQPLDCAKTRIQVGAVPRDSGLLAIVRKVYSEEGMRALWRGGAARALWLTPGCAITITVFEAVEPLLKRLIRP